MKFNAFLLRKIVVISLTFSMLLSIIGIVQVNAATTILADFRYTNNGYFDGDELAGYGTKDIGYKATSGIMAANSAIFASVNGVDRKKIEWADLDILRTSMTASSSNPWVYNATQTPVIAPYFEIKTNTTGYNNITLSMGLCGSNNAPKDYEIQYSIGDGAFQRTSHTFSFTANKTLKTDNDILLPSVVGNQPTVRIRIVVNSNIAIANDGQTYVNGNTSGKLGFQYITINGSTANQLAAPTASVPSGGLLNDDTVALTTHDVATIKYQIDSGAVQTYTGEFAPFANTTNTAVTVKAWTESGTDKSPETILNYTLKGYDLARFNYNDTLKPINSKIDASTGVYNNSKLSASLNGVDSFIPQYDIAYGNNLRMTPDDSLKWSKGGFWQFEVSTAGYKNITLSANAFSSNNGPKSASLKYSTNGIDFTTLETNKSFTPNTLSTYYSDYQLPADLNDKVKVYLRFVFEEDKRADTTDPTPLFDTDTKGSSYINNVVFGGSKDTSLIMPYTNKVSNKFTKGEGIEYICPSGSTAKYDILDFDGNKIIIGATYTTPIILSSINGFNENQINKYTINIWSENGGLKSNVNSKTFSYEGDTLSAFKVSTTIGTKDLSATTGTGTLSAYPNAKDKVTLTYSKNSIYAQAVPATSPVPSPIAWTFDTLRSTPNNDGYWLIKTSTLGHKNISFSSDQFSTEKGPRDFCISYSTDGINYIKLYNSVTRLTLNLTSTYSSFELPKELDNQANVYIKIKIDGGETYTGEELKDNIGSGNTGINNIKICGEKITSGITIDTTDQALIKGKDYTVNSGTLISGSIVAVAGYNNNNLVYIKTYQISPTLTFNIPQESTATSVKIMLLSGTSYIQPLCDSITKQVS